MRLVEAAGALIIFVGAVLAAVAFVRGAVVSRSTREFVRVRLLWGATSHWAGVPAGAAW